MSFIFLKRDSHPATAVPRSEVGGDKALFEL